MDDGRELRSLVIIDDRIDEVHHGLGGFEHEFNLVKPFFVLIEVVRNLVPTAVVLHSKILDMRPVARESRGTGLQFFQSEALWLVPRRYVRRSLEATGLRTSEILLERLVLHTFQPFVGIGHDFVSARGKDIGRQPVVATGHHTMARLQMEIIAPVQRLLAVSGNVSPQVVLIGRLVIREPCVAIETVGAVLYAQMDNRRVEAGNPSNRQLHALFKVRPDGVILCLIGPVPTL